MKRNYQIDEPIPLKHRQLVQQTAFHEAGHAAAIYLCNRQKNLPPVYFQITFGGLCASTPETDRLKKLPHSNWVATVEGGNLIHSLPLSVIESSGYFSDHESHAYQLAYEADIINLLAGPLAEAKYVAERDNETFNPRLVNVEALRYYGGTSDLEKVDEYLEALIATQDKRSKKLNELFLAAFRFVEDPSHWYAINQLAHHILENDNEVIGCEEIIDVIDSALLPYLTYDRLSANFRC